MKKNTIKEESGTLPRICLCTIWTPLCGFVSNNKVLLVGYVNKALGYDMGQNVHNYQLNIHLTWRRYNRMNNALTECSSISHLCFSSVYPHLVKRLHTETAHTHKKKRITRLGVLQMSNVLQTIKSFIMVYAGNGGNLIIYMVMVISNHLCLNNLNQTRSQLSISSLTK